MKSKKEKELIEADKKYHEAIEVFKKHNITKPHKFERKQGIKYILCEHLKTKEFEGESHNIWIGEHTRLIACAICHNVHVGVFFNTLTGKLWDEEALDVQQELIEKKPISENWVINLRNRFLRMIGR